MFGSKLVSVGTLFWSEKAARPLRVAVVPGTCALSKIPPTYSTGACAVPLSASVYTSSSKPGPVQK
jgi:hypothetical protein